VSTASVVGLIICASIALSLNR